MSNQNDDAIEALNRRLASGEITHEQHAEISETINKSRMKIDNSYGGLQKSGALWFIIPPFAVLFVIYSLWFNVPEGERGVMSDGAFIIVVASFSILCFGLTKYIFGK